LPSKLPYHPFATGDRITAVRACGGAYGNPLEREPADVLDDVLDEYISRDKALADYGVVISERFEIDVEATRRQRQALSRN
jgi:N-methylhydantoinase B